MLNQLRKFVTPEILSGCKSRFYIDRYVKNIGTSKLLIVTDLNLIRLGWLRQITSILDKHGIQYTVFDGVTENPKTDEIEKGKLTYQYNNCDGIISLGGGSVIDCAKGIGITVANPKPIETFEGIDQVRIPIPPLICLPTTAGSASDISQFAVITQEEEKRKFAVISRSIVPDISIIDPDFTITLNPYITASSGFDAMVHGIEAYVSSAASFITDIHALEGIRLISENLLPCLQEPDNIEFRKNLMFGSTETGLAFSNAVLGANHALAHSFGGFTNDNHGDVNSLFLTEVIRYNYESAIEKYKNIAEIFGVDTAHSSDTEILKIFLSKLQELIERLPLNNQIDRHFSEEDIRILTENSMKDLCMATNPRTPKYDEIKEIYERILFRK